MMNNSTDDYSIWNSVVHLLFFSSPPTPLPRGEGSNYSSLLPSPWGRGWREAPGEGFSELHCRLERRPNASRYDRCYNLLDAQSQKGEQR
jgi:hypothetical protein